ncbi:hypothetical protein J3R82DRAFT_3584 [Butyriboletus roseoflavus]|nr:hypothetical protein J3R82DRAFT_3584 [Butyriboletus roseoflavus]
MVSALGFSLLVVNTPYVAFIDRPLRYLDLFLVPGHQSVDYHPFPSEKAQNLNICITPGVGSDQIDMNAAVKKNI